MQQIPELLQEHSSVKEGLKKSINLLGGTINDSTSYRFYLQNYCQNNFLISPEPSFRHSYTIASKLTVLNNIARDFRKLLPGKPIFKMVPYLLNDLVKPNTSISKMKSSVVSHTTPGFHFEFSPQNEDRFNWRRNLLDRTDLSGKSGQAFLKSSEAVITTLNNGMVGRDLGSSVENYFYLKGTTKVGKYTFTCLVETGDGTPPIVNSSKNITSDCSFIFKNTATDIKSVTHLSGSIYKVEATVDSDIGVYNFGIVKYATNSVKPIKVSGYQLEFGDRSTEYQEFTDFKEAFKKRFPTHNLYQDADGITPVSDYNQPVGLWLDTLKGDSAYKDIFISNTKPSDSFTLNGVTNTNGVLSGTGKASLVSSLDTSGVLEGVFRIEATGVSTHDWNLRGEGLEGLVTIEGGAFDISIVSSTLAKSGSNLVFELTQGSLKIDTLRVIRILGNHASQTTNSCKPSLKRDTNLSKDYIAFDGIDDFLRIPSPENFKFLHNGTSYSIFCEASAKAGNYNTIISNNNLGGIGIGVSFALDYRSNPKCFATFRNGTNTSYASGGVATAATDKPIAFGYKIIGKTEFNSASIINRVVTLYNGEPSLEVSSRDLVMGKSEASPTSIFKGDVYQLLCIGEYLSQETHNYLLNLYHKDTKTFLNSSIDYSEDVLKEPFTVDNSKGFYINPNNLESVWSDPYCISKPVIGSSVGFIADNSERLSTLGNSDILPNLVISTAPSSVSATPSYYSMAGDISNKVTISGFSPNTLYCLHMNTISAISGTLTMNYKGVSSPIESRLPGLSNVYFNAGESPSSLVISSTNSNTNIRFCFISIKEVGGSHFSQETVENRPTLRKDAVTKQNYLDFSTVTQSLNSLKDVSFKEDCSCIATFSHKTFNSSSPRVCSLLTHSNGFKLIYSDTSKGIFTQDVSNSSFVPSKINETVCIDLKKDGIKIHNDLFTNYSTNFNQTTGKLKLGCNNGDTPNIHLYGLFLIDRSLLGMEKFHITNTLCQTNGSVNNLSLKDMELSVKDNLGLTIDANDHESLFQDISGRVPVSGFNQPVALVLDKFKSKKLSKNLCTVTSILSPPTSITPTVYLFPLSEKPLEPNTMYEVRFKVSKSIKGIEIGFDTYSFGNRIRVSTDGDYIFRTFTENSSVIPSFFTSTSYSAYITNISIRKIGGSFAYQDNTSSRPLLKISTKGTSYFDFDGIDDFLKTNKLGLDNSFNLVISTPKVVTSQNNQYNTLISSSGDLNKTLEISYLDNKSISIVDNSKNLNIVTQPIIESYLTLKFNYQQGNGNLSTIYSTNNGSTVSNTASSNPTTSRSESLYAIGRNFSGGLPYKGGISFISLTSSLVGSSNTIVFNENMKRG